MTEHTTQDLLLADQRHVWPPYAAANGSEQRLLVRGARGVYLELADGTRLIDGMSSWWSALLGHAHPELVRAGQQQLERLPHVMFGGLTHEPAILLAEQLSRLAPGSLPHVFFSDSGSVSVEVALKMARQWWIARQRSSASHPPRFIALRGAYHGDTWGAMSVCDPDLSWHRLHTGSLSPQLFAPRPSGPPHAPATMAELEAVESLLRDNAQSVCAVIVEPIVQGAGGMHFYSIDYLTQLAALCRRYDVLLIADEIATGFGRTGRLFACDHAGAQPDILCVGKALTGGTVTLAATLTTAEVANVIASREPYRLMHGPTFMGNPLACAMALRTLSLLLEGDWQARVAEMEAQLRSGLAPAADYPGVQEVRCFGAIGVIEMRKPLSLPRATQQLVAEGVWLRPFGRLLYTMPPFIATPQEISRICNAMLAVARHVC